MVAALFRARAGVTHAPALHESGCGVGQCRSGSCKMHARRSAPLLAICGRQKPLMAPSALPLAMQGPLTLACS